VITAHYLVILALAAPREPLDADGADDCLTSAWEGGSGFGGLRFELRPGCGSDTLTGGSFSAFSEHLHVTTYDGPAPSRVLHDALVARLGGAPRHCLAPRAGCPEIDGSFAWLLDEVASRRAVTGTTSESPWRRYTPRWSMGRTPILPDPQLIDLPPDRADLVTVLDAGEVDRPRLALRMLAARLTGRPLGWIEYPAHTHGALAPRAGCARWDLYTTAHAVAVVDRARWSWAFVSTAGDKLRHPSIVDATCGADGLVRVTRRIGEAAPESIVIDPARGLWRVEARP